MHFYLVALSWIVVAYVLYSFIDSVVTRRRDAAKAKSLGCKKPVFFSGKWPLSIDLVQENYKGDSGHYFPDLLIERNNKIGATTHEYKILGVTQFFTSDPKNIQAILATQFQDFALGPTRRGNFFPLLGNGIFTADGKNWEHSRTLLRPQFARDQVSDLELEEGHVQNMMRALPATRDGWTSDTDLQVFFFRLTLDSACEFLLGESPGSQIANLPENVSNTSKSTTDEKTFADAFDVSQRWLARRFRLMDKYWLINTAEFRQSCKATHDFVDHFVRLALDTEAKEKEVEKGSFSGKKEKYVFANALAAEVKDPIELRSQLLNILLAGRDTTASLLGWLFFTLARHPDQYAKLRAAIVDDFGTYNSPSDKELTFTNLKNCTHLQNCLHEALRLFPVVPFNLRFAIKDTTLPRGGGPDGESKVFIKKGQSVDYSVHVMHHRKDIWGDDAESFRPERFTGRRNGFEYLPFNGGPRICLGQQFALTEASYVTARLLQRFDRLENLDPVLEPKHNLTLTNASWNGVKCRLHEARE